MGEEIEKTEYRYDSLISNKTVSELTGLLPSDISNRKKRHSDFPSSQNGEKKTPLYRYGDVLKWACAHDVPINGRKIIYKDIVQLEMDFADNILSICICGRSRSSKSFIASYFLEDFVFIRQCLCGTGVDYTQIPVRIIVDGSFPYFYLKIDDAVKNEDIPDEIRNYANRQVFIDQNSGDFSYALHKIFDWVKVLRGKYGKAQDIYKVVSLDLFGRPSRISRNIMEQSGKKMLVIYDMPGKSGSLDWSFSITHQDVVIYAMRDENIDDFESSMKKLSGLVGAHPVIYVYRVSESVTEETEYVNAQNVAANAMKQFELKIGEILKNSIIASSISALHPLEHFVALPSFKSQKYLDVEHCFESELEKRIVEGIYSRISYDQLHTTISRAGLGKGDIPEVLKLLADVMKIPELENDRAGLKTGKHRKIIKNQKKAQNINLPLLIETLDYISQKALDDNLIRLRSFDTDDYPKEWQQIIIKYAFQTIDRALREFPTVGRSTRPWEHSSPLLTIFELLYAKEIFAELSEFEMKLTYTPETRREITNRYRTVILDASNRFAVKFNYAPESITEMMSDLNNVIADPYTLYSMKILKEHEAFEAADDLENGLSEEELIRDHIVDCLFYYAVHFVYFDVLRAIDPHYNDNMSEITAIVEKLFR